MTSVTAPPPTAQQATIAAGATGLSIGVRVAGKLSGLVLTTSWVSAAITFQYSQDGVTWFDVWEQATGTGVERTIAAANVPTSGGRYFSLSLIDWVGVNWVRLRSGTSAAPVNQTGGATLLLILAG